MALCKYCGAPLNWYITDFCDSVCRRMYELNGQPLKVEKKEKDQFDDFVEKQKEAREKGIKYSYGDYQKEHSSPIDIPKPKTDPDKMQCQDCKHFVAGIKDQNKCVMKPYTRDGKRRFYPQKFQKACKTYFEPRR